MPLPREPRRATARQTCDARALYALALSAITLCGACVEAACWAGCSEEEADCTDDPEAYDGFGRCDGLAGEQHTECVESMCRSVYQHCNNTCATSTELEP
jgi:hypothetical protein